MTDIVSEERRSYLMSRVKGKNTKPELAVRSALHRKGFRFTVNGPRNKQLPGRPDIVLPSRMTVIFVHGCFWHAHESCPDFRIPKTRTEWWQTKIFGNRDRDFRHYANLREMGWRVLIVWTCALSTRQGREALGEALADALTETRSDLEFHDRDRNCLTWEPLYMYQ